MMQSATPHWALSSGVIKAFKHRHPLSLHMSALQSVFVTRLALYPTCSLCRLPCLLFSSSLFLTNAVGARKVLGPL